MANAKYNSFKRDVITGIIDLDTDSISCMLVDATYVPDIDTHTTTANVTGEVTGTGYTAGGQALTTKSVVVDTVNDLARFDADDVTWAASTITARAAILYRTTGGNLIAYFDFGTDQSSSNGDFTVQWNTSGILTLT